MDEVVAIRVRDRTRGMGYFLTWGRVYDRVDPGPLLSVVRAVLERRDFREIEELNVCLSLAEASREFYFYEAMLRFGWERPSYGKRYASWQKRMRAKVASGEAIVMATPIEAPYLRKAKVNYFKSAQK